MSNWPFRFVHASDFHLEQPPSGMAEVPEHLRDVLLDAPYTAAERVFQTVLAEDAALLILAGDILHPQYTGPRGPLFLVEQFARLAERGTAVYWAGGEVDPPDAWPSAVALPENVHLFPRGRVDEFVHQHEGSPLLRLAGTSREKQRPIRANDFTPDAAGLYSVAVVHGAADAAALQARGIHYWALGGRHERGTILNGPQLAHYPGTPQGRCPDEAGIHGCTLVQVDEQRQSRTSLIPTDALRWLSERVVFDETTSRNDLETRLRERMHALLENAPRLDLMVSWTLAGCGPLLAQLRRGGLSAELLGWLRSEYGFTRPAAWSVSIEVECAAPLPPEWYEQETIRGDFLRTIRQLELAADEPLNLESFVAEKHLAGTLASAVAIADKPARQRVLREAALLGVDLLSGEEPQS
jgi:DNA repair protein SbcD/Mre11